MKWAKKITVNIFFFKFYLPSRAAVGHRRFRVNVRNSNGLFWHENKSKHTVQVYN